MIDSIVEVEEEISRDTRTFAFPLIGIAWEIVSTDVPYSLNVSSLGLDRPLTTEYQFNKYKGQEVELKFYKPLMPYNKKQIVAILTSWDDENVVVKIEDDEVKILRKSIAQIVPVIKF